MTENMKRFFEEVTKSEEHREKLNAAKNMEEVTAFAAELGFTLTAEDFQQEEGELQDDELNAVTGGKECACVLGGGGTGESEREHTCWCVAIGNGSYICGTQEMSRCGCVATGTGENQS